MLSRFSGFARSALHAHSRNQSSVTVGQICRTVRGKVAGEEGAVALDNIMRDIAPSMEKVPGYVRTTRKYVINKAFSMF